jgi:hypothetical protein
MRNGAGRKVVHVYAHGGLDAALPDGSVVSFAMEEWRRATSTKSAPTPEASKTGS